MLEFVCLAGNKTKEVPPGQAIFTSPGTYSFVVPDGVETLMIACQGGGGSPLIVYSNKYCQGGQGGYTAYSNTIPVTPGETLTVVVAAAKANYTNTSTNTTLFEYPANLGNPSLVRRGSTNLVYAPGGSEGATKAVGTYYVPRSLDSISGGSGFGSDRNRLGGDAAGFQSNPGSTGLGSIGGKGVNLITGSLNASPSTVVGGSYGGGGGVTFSSATTMSVGGGAAGCVRILWNGTATNKRSIPNNMPNV
ncbi:hypothetical protein pEaSNUABM37_00164 [Erwinia phage pEa_SNUABM_37]|nr:hypothetical protein pEaSNUABM37_00164 [Erwinia phage pEa_SNUABM_37]QXO10634.1 hypothetical protein pEaSNUABM48_00164 [Erwinia phage pEa_SNUABM_48]